jgi:Transglutaminase-like superfamily
MKKYPLLRASWFVVNLLLIVSLGAVLYSSAWEYSTRSYLKGFSDAIIPASDNPEQKIEAILHWMAHGPERRNEDNTGALAARNPEETLNVQQLLNVCGTATNAFVNLAQSSGLRARRLLLLDARGLSKHVVVEVLIGGRWVVVDPSYRFQFRLPDGTMATLADLKVPANFRAATQSIPDYPESYTYERTVHVRLLRIPWLGRYLRKLFNFLWPSWEETINWTLLVERESFAMLTASLLLLCFALAARLVLGWYGTSRLGIARVRLRDQIRRAGQVLAGSAQWILFV